MVKKTYYKYWGEYFEECPSNFVQGTWMLTVIIFFPIWIWIYLVYKLVIEVGKLNGKPIKIEIEEKEKEEKHNYY